MNENQTREKAPAEAVKETAMPMAVLSDQELAAISGGGGQLHLGVGSDPSRW